MVRTLDSMCGGKRRLLERWEWSQLLRQDSSWEHYAMHRPEPHVLLFRRPIGGRDGAHAADGGATSGGGSNGEASDAHADANASSQNSNRAPPGGARGRSVSVESPARGSAGADWHEPFRRGAPDAPLRAPMKRHGRGRCRAALRAGSASPRRLRFADEESAGASERGAAPMRSCSSGSVAARS